MKRKAYIPAVAATCCVLCFATPRASAFQTDAVNPGAGNSAMADPATGVSNDLDPTVRAHLKNRLGLRDFDVIRVDVTAGPPEAATLDLNIAGQRRSVFLERYSLCAADFQYVENDLAGNPMNVTPPPERTYRGFADGDPDQFAALSILREGLLGVVRLDDGAVHFIEPVVLHLPDADPALQIVYTTADVIDTHVCGVALPGAVAAAGRAGDPAGVGATNDFDGIVHAHPRDPGDTAGPADSGHPGAGPMPFGDFEPSGICLVGVARIALVSDASYTNAFPPGVAFSLASAQLASMNAIYGPELGIHHILAQFVANSSNPYALVPVGGGEVSFTAMLASFKSWYLANHATINRDLAHCLSRENFQGDVLGHAEVGALCSVNGAFGVDQLTNASAVNTVVLSHECGHNWGATHCTGGDCAIMAASICGNCPTQPTTFGTQATNEILATLDEGCVNRPADCNHNGVCDGVDLLNGTLHDQNNDGWPDECERVINLNTTARFATIQSAIYQAFSGNTIQVKWGVYNEAIQFDGKDLTLVSESGRLSTTIDASGLNTTTVSILNDESVMIDGFRITGGVEHPDFMPVVGGGIFVFDGALNLTNAIVGGNTVSPGGFGGGVIINGTGASATISNTIFCENSPNDVVGTFTNGGGLTAAPVCPAMECAGTPGDINKDGLIDGRDVQKFVDCYFTGATLGGDCLCTDLSGNGITTELDLNLFVAALVQ